MNPLERMKPRIAATLIRWTITALSWTYRVDHACGEELVKNVVRDRRAVIVAFWHARLFYLGAYLEARFLRRGHDLTVFASRSRDGELGARLVQAWGGRVVRGSTSRGGLQGLRAMYRTISREGASPVITPDGPRGPRNAAQSGTVVLAQMSGAPILPIAYAADRCWHLRSWDRMLIPKPFARVSVAVGQLLEVPRDLDSGGIERYRVQLEANLNDLVRRAEEHSSSPRGSMNRRE